MKPLDPWVLLVYKQNGRVNLSATVEKALKNTYMNSASEAYKLLRQFVGNEMIYTVNTNGRRVPRSHEEWDQITSPEGYKNPPPDERNQHEALLAHCRRLATLANEEPKPPVPQEYGECSGCFKQVPVEEINKWGWCIDCEIAPKPEPEPPAPRVKTPYERLKELRRDLDSYCSDSLSMRSMLNSAAMLKVGIPLEAVAYALTIDLKPEMRRQIGVKDYNILKFGEAPESGYHRALPYLEKLAEAGIPVLLKGPAGFGKSYMGRQLADYLGRPYRETPISPGAMRSDLLGKDLLNKFVRAGLTEMYESGGVFNFEEIDAAEPGILLTVNNMLANAHFDNPSEGKVIQRHDDFLAIATANTWGTGANKEYTGRERQDGASLDRFRAGRIEVLLDENLEQSLFEKAMA